MSASFFSARLGLPTVAAIVAVVAAGSFAAGQSISPATPPPSVQMSPPPPTAEPSETDDNVTENAEPLPPGHPPTTGAALRSGGELPAGHPQIDTVDPNAEPGSAAAAPSGQDAPVEWTAPARWTQAPNANPMRLATYRVPRAAGDTDDAELSITRAGGSVEANAERWIGQFDSMGQKTATRSARKVGPLDVAVVAVQGTYSGGMSMGKEASARAGWALLGAIVSTGSTPYFFKLTGPARTVLAARAEFDAMIASLSTR